MVRRRGDPKPSPQGKGGESFYIGKVVDLLLQNQNCAIVTDRKKDKGIQRGCHRGPGRTPKGEREVIADG